jgi:hypothetical protein
MKRFILSAVAVGALALGGAASAQDIFGLGNVLPQILGNVGLGGVGGVGSDIPAVVAGTPQAGGSVYADAYGRRIYVEPSGRQVALDANGTYVDQFGRRVYVDAYGRSVLAQPGVAVNGAGRIVLDPYGRQVALDQFGSYVDAAGNRILVDAYGRHTRLDQYGSYRDPMGRQVYYGANGQPAYVDQNGQLMAYGSVYGTTTASLGRPWDRDGDGIANRSDRYPDDPRYR